LGRSRLADSAGWIARQKLIAIVFLTLLSLSITLLEFPIR
jgi:hypothetical protein